MSEFHNLRKTARLNQGVPPKRYGSDSDDMNLKKVSAKAFTIQNGDDLEKNKNKDNLSKSVIFGTGASTSKIKEIRNKKREIELRMLKLQMESLEQEEEALTESRSEISSSVSQRFSMNDYEEDFEYTRTKEWVEKSKGGDEPQNQSTFITKNPKVAEAFKNPERLPVEYDKGYIETRNQPMFMESNMVERNMIRSEDPGNQGTIFAETLVKCMQDLNKNLTGLAFKHQPLDLPDFYGNINEFPLWLAEFNRSTEDRHCSDNDNLNRLQKCLKGRAREAVRDLFCSPSNVTAIIETLKMNFGREDWIIMNQMEKVRKCPSPREDSIESFLYFSSCISNMIVLMKNIGCSRYLENPEVLYQLENKISRPTRRLWAEYKVSKQKSGVVTLEDFSNWLKSEVNILMAVSGPSQEYFPKRYAPEKAKLYNVKATSPSDKNCKLCNGNFHKLFACKIFLENSVQERREYLEENRRCYKCLGEGHAAKKCYSKISCKIEGCHGRHNTLVHQEVAKKEENTKDEENQIACLVRNDTHALLKIAKIRLHNGSKSFETFALLDEGSTITLVDSQIAEKLNLRGPTSPICLQWANKVSKTENNSMLVSLEISNINESKKKFKIKNARTVKNLSLPNQVIDFEDMCRKYDYLDKETLRNIANASPKILIGQDNAFLLYAQEIIHPRFDQPVLSKTRLGWVVHGPYKKNETSQFNVNLCKHDEEYLRDRIEENFKLEGHNIETEKTEFSKEDQRALEIFNNTIKKTEKGYDIGLPWKKDNIVLPSSRQVALSRLNCMEKKMDLDEDIATEYCKRIEEYEEKGYAEKIIDTMENGKTWYVFDAAAKINGVSLNDFLLKGPDFYPLLVGILWRFREQKYAFCGDIREMFHQVRIRKEDRCCQRFLLRGMDKYKDPDVYEMKAMILGTISSPSIAQFVENYSVSNAKEEYPDIMNITLKQHYVDDYLDSKSSLKEAINTIQSVIVHERGEFSMVRLSNSKEILNYILRSHMSSEKILKIDSPKKKNDRILGLCWNIEDDNFIFQFKFKKVIENLIAGNEIPTKREVLKMIMTIFDPIGFLSPYIIQGRITFQDCWRKDLEWNENLPDKVFEKWKKRKKQYLPTLRKRQKWHTKCTPPKVDDIVAPPCTEARNKWKLAKVTKIYPGKDGQIRSVEIKTATSSLIRPVNRLLWLEVGECKE